MVQDGRALDKGIALLKSLVAPHDGLDKNDDHAWGKCRRCLAREELDHKGSDDALKAVLAQVQTRPNSVSEGPEAALRVGMQGKVQAIQDLLVLTDGSTAGDCSRIAAMLLLAEDLSALLVSGGARQDDERKGQLTRVEQKHEDDDDSARMDTMGEGTDSRTASENEVTHATYEALSEALVQLTTTYALAARSARKTDAGTGSWWEMSGYVDVLKDALQRAANHRHRVVGVDRQIAQEARR